MTASPVTSSSALDNGSSAILDTSSATAATLTFTDPSSGPTTIPVTIPQYPQQGFPELNQGYFFPGHHVLYQVPFEPVVVQEEEEEEQLSFCAEFGIHIAASLTILAIYVAFRIYLRR